MGVHSAMTGEKQRPEHPDPCAEQGCGPRLSELLLGISDGVFSLDRDFRVTHFNQAAERLLGRPAAEVLGRRMFDEAFPEAKGSIFEEQYARALQERSPRSFETYFGVEPYANWYDVKVYPSGEGILVFFQVTTQARRGQRELDNFFNLSEELLCIAGLDGYFKRVNPSFERVLGYSQEELLAAPFLDLVHPDDRDRTIALMADLTQGQPAINFENRYRTKGGDYRWFSWMTRPAPDEGLLYAVARDVTDFKRVQQDLARRTREMQTILDSMPATIWFKDKENRFLRVNQATAKMMGRRVEEIEGRHAREVFPEWLAEKYHQDDLEVIGSGTPKIGIEELYANAAGELRSVRTDKVPWHDDQGRVAGVLAFAVDVTERKQTEEALRESQRQAARLSGLLENSSQPFAVGYADGRLGLCNPAYLDLLGYAEQELRAIDWSRDLTPARWQAVEEEKLAELLRDSRPVRYEKEYIRKDGSLVPVEMFVHLARDEEGRPEYFFAFVTDISERKKAEKALRESEEHFRSLFENMLNGVAHCRMIFADGQPQDFIYLDVNDAFARLTGLKDVAGKPVSEVIPGIREADPELFAIYGRVARTGRPEKFETYVEALEMWFEVSVYCPRPEHFVAIFDVITERKRAEERARWLARFPSENPNPVLRVDRQGEIIYANPASAVLLGYWGRQVGERLPSPWRQAAEAALAGGGLIQRDLEAHDKVFALSFAPMAQEGYLNIYGMDISVRRQAQEALLRERDRAQNYLDVAGTIFVALDTEGRVTLANKKCCQVLDYAEGEILGKNWFETFLPESHRQEVGQVFRKLVGGELDLLEYFENPILARDGKERLISWHNAYFLDETGRVTGALCSGEDVTEQRRAEAELARSERRYQQMFTEMLNGIALHEIICEQDGKPADYRFLEVNPAFERLTGLKREEIVGHTVREAMPGTEPRWIETYGRVALTGKPAYFENYAQDLDKHFEVAAFSPEPGRFAVIFSDVTTRKKAEEERKQLEAQIQHAQKLESLGVLAGGIAHDFNNLLVSILGNADLALLDIPRESPARRRLEDLRDTAIRASELSNQMLAYSGKGHFMVHALSLNRLVDEMGHLLRVSIPKNVVLKYDYHSQLPAVEVDATQIRQVVMNLITNAAEAVGQRSGVVTISTGVTEVDQNYLKGTYVDDDLEPGYYAYLEVSDTGQGMDAETRARIFDPFFTTKFAGRGLGLSAVLGIVRGHRGAIKVYSEPNRGTSFKVLLPCRAGRPEAGESRPAAEAPAPPAEGGLVLVVDDEESVRSVTKMMLERQGFKVITAEDGRRGVDIFRERAGELKAVILDMTMPHLNGEQAFGEMRRISAQVPVILASGYNEQEATSRFTGKGLAGFIQKPFRMKDLLATLAKALERRA